MESRVYFEQNVSPEALTGCWLWTKGYGGNGYPTMYHKGGAYKVSRFSYETYKEALKPGQVVRHLCHNPSCVNPSHLISGSQTDNMQDSVKSGRLNKKLTDENVLAILEEYVPFSVSLKTLAIKYGVSKRNILDIVKGRKFKHLYAKAKKTNS